MAHRHSRSELSLATQTVGARLRSAVRTGAVLVLCWLALWGLGTAWAVRADTTEPQRYVFMKWHQAQLAAGLLNLPRWRMHYEDATGVHPVTAGQLYAWPPLADAAQTVRHRILIRARQCGLAALLLTILLAFGLHRLGVGLRRDHRLRGGYLVAAADLGREIRRRKQASPYTVGGVPLVRGSETLHTLILGATGSGKSVLLDSLVRQFGRGMPILIYDTKGDFLSRQEAHGRFHPREQQPIE